MSNAGHPQNLMIWVCNLDFSDIRDNGKICLFLDCDGHLQHLVSNYSSSPSSNTSDPSIMLCLWWHNPVISLAILGNFLQVKLAFRPIEFWFWCDMRIKVGWIYTILSLLFHSTLQFFNCRFGERMLFRLCRHRVKAERIKRSWPMIEKAICWFVMRTDMTGH